MIMHSISANYTMPTILNSLTPAATNGLQRIAGTRPASTSGSTTSSNSAGGLGTTFLSLLAQELQNQDPTAPVDPTAMVGQMISLNSLEQLITINQTLTTPPTTTTPPPTTGGVQPAGTTTGTAIAAANSGIAGTLSPSTAGAATSQLPFDPTTMMPLSSGNAAAVAASINSSINAASMGLSGTSNNNASGGK
jgi:flagellar basal-body rod modification protein FlgD